MAAPVPTTERRYRLGGTDLAALFSLSPFRSEHDTWLEKTGQLRDLPRTTNTRAVWGNKLQRVVADAYTETTGRPHEWIDRTILHPKLPEIGCWTPDALLTRDDGGLDAKTTAPDQSHNWGDPFAEPDSVPDYVNLQCQWYLSASDRAFWDIALLVSGSELRVYRVLADLELQEIMMERAQQWWTDHVLANIPPPMTATATADAYLKHRHPRNSGVLRVPTGAEAVIIEDFLLRRAVLKAATKEYDDAEVKLKAAIKDDDGFRFSGFDRITFKRCKDTMGVDYEAMAKWAAPDDLERLQKHFYGVRREGSRRLDVRVSEGK